MQEVSGGTIYDNVSGMSQCLIDSPYVACINSHQGEDCVTLLEPVGPTLAPPLRAESNMIPNHDQCKDYKVKYCCGKPKPKCYCCPPELPVNECQDTGCKAYLNGLGECVDVTNPAWDDLDYTFDLSKAVQGKPAADLCSSSLDTSCCRCMKIKTCKDNGCEASFGGNGKHSTLFCIFQIYFLSKGPSIEDVCKFSRFLTPPSSVVTFLLLAIGKFDKFLTPPPLKNANI